MFASTSKPSRLVVPCLVILGLFSWVCSGRCAVPTRGNWNSHKTRKALAHLGTEQTREPRQDLTRYLRYDPSLINRARRGDEAKESQRTERHRSTKAAIGGADSALEPLVALLRRAKLSDPSLVGKIERVAEGYLRAGFGVPRRFHALVREGTKPLRASLSELTRALRAARSRASVHKTHVTIGDVMAKAQESHYLLSKLYTELFRTETQLARGEPAIAKLAPSAGLAGRVALCLIQVGRASRTNLRTAIDTLDQDRQDLKRAFSSLGEALAHMDSGLERSWGKSTDQVVMADLPGSLKTVYRHLNSALDRLKEISRRGPAVEQLIKVNYRSAVASIVALTGVATAGRVEHGDLSKLAEACEAGHALLRSVLVELDKEHEKLIAWARAIRGKRAQELDLPFPPDFILLAAEPPRDADTNSDGAILFNPTVSAASFAEKSSHELEAPVTLATPPPATAPLNGEEVVAFERDMSTLDELERLLRPSADLHANSTTAAFVDAKVPSIGPGD